MVHDRRDRWRRAMTDEIGPDLVDRDGRAMLPLPVEQTPAAAPAGRAARGRRPSPRGVGWQTRTTAITDLVVAQDELAALDGERDRAMKVRDVALRAARDAGWTYDDIIARTGVSSTTIANAVRRG